MNVIPSTDSSDVITARAGSLAPCASMGASDTKARNRTDPASLGCIWLSSNRSPWPATAGYFFAHSALAAGGWPARSPAIAMPRKRSCAIRARQRHQSTLKHWQHVVAAIGVGCRGDHRFLGQVEPGRRTIAAGGRAAGGQFLDAAGRTDRARRHWRWRWRCRWSAKSNPSRRPYAR